MRFSQFITLISFVILTACGGGGTRPVHTQQEAFLNNGDTPSNSDLVPLPAANPNDHPATADPTTRSDTSRSVTVGCQTLAITTSHLPDGVYGVAYGGDDGHRLEIDGACGQYSCTVTGLPTGLTYANGVISGTPTELGTHSLSITCSATDGSSSAQKNLDLAIKDNLAIEIHNETATDIGPAVVFENDTPPAALIQGQTNLCFKAVGHATTDYTWSVDGAGLSLTPQGDAGMHCFTVAADHLGALYPHVVVTVADTNGNTASTTLNHVLILLDPCTVPLVIHVDRATNAGVSVDLSSNAHANIDEPLLLTFSATGGHPENYQWTFAHGMIGADMLNYWTYGMAADRTFHAASDNRFFTGEVRGDLSQQITVTVADSACGGTPVTASYVVHWVWPGDTVDHLKIRMKISDVEDTDAGDSRMIIFFLKKNQNIQLSNHQVVQRDQVVAWAEYMIDECYHEDQHIVCEREKEVHVNHDCTDATLCGSVYAPRAWEIPVTDIDRIVVYFEDPLHDSDCFVVGCASHDDAADFDIWNIEFYTQNWYAVFNDGEHGWIDNNVVQDDENTAQVLDRSVSVYTNDPGADVILPAFTLCRGQCAALFPHALRDDSTSPARFNDGLHFSQDVAGFGVGAYDITSTMDGSPTIWHQRLNPTVPFTPAEVH